jgi:hypothetical protein
MRGERSSGIGRLWASGITRAVRPHHRTRVHRKHVGGPFACKQSGSWNERFMMPYCGAVTTGRYAPQDQPPVGRPETGGHAMTIDVSTLPTPPMWAFVVLGALVVLFAVWAKRNDEE